jgi:hypothetical protein
MTKQTLNLNSVIYFFHLYLVYGITYYFALQSGLCIYFIIVHEFECYK